MKVNALTRQPHRKRPGEGRGRRTINGSILDVAHAALFFGLTEKMLRARVARGTLPFRRLGSRVVFVKRDLEEFLLALDGVDVRQALVNLQERAGGSAERKEAATGH